MNHAVDLVRLYDNLEQAGVDVFTMSLNTYDALASASCSCIAINPARVHTETHEREILIHEEGHFATDTFYEFDSPYTVREHQETVACRYVIKKYFSLDSLLDLMEEKHTEPWDLAEQLGVSEKFICEILDYYTQAQGINFEFEVERRKKERDSGADTTDVATALTSA